MLAPGRLNRELWPARHVLVSGGSLAGGSLLYGWISLLFCWIVARLGRYRQDCDKRSGIDVLRAHTFSWVKT